MGWWDWLFKTLSTSSSAAAVERSNPAVRGSGGGAIAAETAEPISSYDAAEPESNPWWTPEDQPRLDPVDIRPTGNRQPVTYLENILISHFDGHDLRMPQLNHLAEHILSSLRNERCDLKTIGRKIAEDQILSAAVLRTANSPMYRGLAKNTTVQEAVTRIGIKALRTVLMNQSVRSAIFGRNSLTKQFANILWRRSLADACIMRGLGGLMRMDEDDCHLAGLLHDIGSVLVLRIIDDQLRMGCPAIDFSTFEYLRLQTHQEFGELIAKAWQLPPDVTHLITNHHAYPKPGEALVQERWMLILTEMIGAMLYADEPPNYDLIQCRPAVELGLSARMEYHDWLTNLPPDVEQSLQGSDK
jgi:HD-like signal output (HDOD) protein